MGIFSAISDWFANPDNKDKIAGWGSALEGDPNAYATYQTRVHTRHAANAASAPDGVADTAAPPAAPAPAPAPAAPASAGMSYNPFTPQAEADQRPVDQMPTPAEMIAKLLPRPNLPMQNMNQQNPFSGGLGRRLY